MHTIDTIMPSLANLRVHIAPVGFEVDRIVIPVKQTRADKIWLLVHNNSSEDKSLPYQKKLEQQFKKLKIQVEIGRINIPIPYPMGYAPNEFTNASDKLFFLVSVI